MKSVSVAMATYNGGRYLLEQLQSLASQIRPPAELVVTDDVSTDDTLAILAEFSDTAPFPVRVYVNPQRLGYRANFMRAASLCSSDIIAFCDQDDVWQPDKLQRCVDVLERTDALMVYHNAIVTDSALNPIGTLARYALAKSYNPPLSVDPFLGCYGFTFVFDRQLVQFSSLWDRPIGIREDGKNPNPHDQWYFFLAHTLGALAYVDAPLAKYRRHESTTTSSESDWIGESRLSLAPHFLFECLGRWEHLALVFERRAAILDEIAQQPAIPQAASARAGAEKYQAIARLYRERIALYQGDRIVRRFRRFMGILTSGGYRSGDVWAKGPKSGIKDLLLGVLGVSRIVPAAAKSKLRGY
ncbi:glycosyltransferase [Paraburkholderia adhaesiva]|uniref:glycosyltransferase n=1 Tax=Paraburkholderia adhaesiva TaxID=2883244 RepID=UPI001F181963|nr:glycosyltransferase [Paraburkholderia adhaesiva]